MQVVGYSLYPTEVAWVEQTASSLKKGLPLASRSFIVRQAILHLQQELDGKSAKRFGGSSWKSSPMPTKNNQCCERLIGVINR